MDLSTQAGAAVLFSILLQAVKKSSWFPFITMETEKLNQYVTIIGSGLVTLGIRVACSKADHNCTIQWQDGLTIVGGLWHWFLQWAAAHGWYKLTK